MVEALPKETFEELLSNTLYTDYVFELTNKIRAWTGKPPTVLSPQQRALSELSNARIEFAQIPDLPGIIYIKGTASTPRVAMDLVNTYIQVLVNRSRNASQEDSQKAIQFLQAQTQQTKQSLAEAEDALSKFQQQRGRVRLGSQTELDLVKLSQEENALAEAQANWEVLGPQITALRQKLNQQQAKAPAETQAKDKERRPDATPAPGSDLEARILAFKTAQERLVRLEAKLSNLRDRYTEANPLVKVAQDEVSTQRAHVAQLAKELPPLSPGVDPQTGLSASRGPTDRLDIEKQLATLEAAEASLRSKVEILRLQVARLRANLKNINQDELELTNLRRNVESQRNLLASLSDKLMLARMRDQGGGLAVRIIDPASFPLSPSQTKTQRYFLMVLALAAGVALGAACGIEYWRQPIEMDSDVEKTTGLPVLGSVGVFDMPNGKAKGAAGKRLRPVPLHLPDTAGKANVHMELYRAIRAMIETDRLRAPFRSILITSPNPHEGKSTTVLNLAHAFVQFGRRVLVVDADLRRPAIHRTLSLTNKPGIVDFLERRATFEQVCRTLPSGVTVIPGQTAGRDAASLLASPRAKELLETASAQFDLVLLDSAPLLAVPDNLLLLSLLDRLVLVIKASSTSKRELQKAQAIAQKAGTQILGVVVNQARPQDVYYYRPKYRKYYRPEHDGATADSGNGASGASQPSERSTK